MDEPESLDGVTLRQPMHAALRILLVAAGLFCIAVSTWELGRGLWPISIATPIFGMIIIGAWTVGGQFLLAGLYGESQVWRFDGGGLTVEFSNPFARRSLRYGAAQVVDVGVHAIEWDSRSDSYAVVVSTADGQRLQTADYGDRRGAEHMRRRMVRHFGLADSKEAP